MDLADKRKRADFSKRFNEYLEKWLKEKHRTQQDFCSVAGVSKNTVTDWKKGRRYPQDAQMMKISEVFEIDPRALAPFFPLDRNAIDNSLCEERSKELQKYADEKGLNEEFYQYFASKPQFIRDFPFSRKSFLPYTGFAPVKFQFMDDNKELIMMQEKDIDFLIELQNHTDNTIDYMMYRKRKKMDRARVEDLVDCALVRYPVDRTEVLDRLYKTDFKKENPYIDYDLVSYVVEQIAKEQGVKMRRITKQNLIDAFITQNPLHNEQWEEQWKEWGRIYGKEEEAERRIREAREEDKKLAEKMMKMLRERDLLEEKEV